MPVGDASPILPLDPPLTRTISNHFDHWIDHLYAIDKNDFHRIDGGCKSAEDNVDRRCESNANLTTFSTQLRPQKNVICLTEKTACTFSGPAETYISQLMYVNISKQNIGRWCRLCRYSQQFNHRRIYSYMACALLGTGGSVGVWSSDPGRAKIPGVDVWFWSSITAHWTWYFPHSSSCKERISKYRQAYMFWSSTQHGSYNACRVSTCRGTRSSDCQPSILCSGREISFSSLSWLKTIPFNLWIAAAKHRHMSRRPT